MSETLADQLKRLCCAETEGKFFDCVTDNIDTIIAALVGSGTWLPIETAPKDKTQIIVCGTYSDDVAIVRWDERKKDWLCLADGVAVIESQGDTWTDYSYFSVPSHWQPCPVARRAAVSRSLTPEGGGE